MRLLHAVHYEHGVCWPGGYAGGRFDVTISCKSTTGSFCAPRWEDAQTAANARQYLNRKPLAHKPTEHLSYDEGLHLIRSFLEHSSKYTVEDLQAFSSQWVPHPQWVRVDHVEIPEDHLSKAADLLIDQLGPEGLRKVGGSKWWQWRKPKSPLKAEWIEMKADYRERRKRGDPGNRVMLYVHGGAYYFGSIDMHRYQIQRHARKLKARALAPDYRLAPQFPFPCGLQDCLATYLWLISQQKPSTVILAGDSAGGGMVLSMLVVLRDRGIPLPAGAVLISPWCDLTHSFPSVAEDCPLDYIPPTGFHHKPSIAWPPPDEEELKEMSKLASGDTDDGDEKVNQSEKKASPTTPLSVIIDGENVEIKEQIQVCFSFPFAFSLFGSRRTDIFPRCTPPTSSSLTLSSAPFSSQRLAGCHLFSSWSAEEKFCVTNRSTLRIRQLTPRHTYHLRLVWMRRLELSSIDILRQMFSSRSGTICAM